MVPLAKEISLSTDIYYLFTFFCSKWVFLKAAFFQEIFRFCKIQGHFLDLENEFDFRLYLFKTI